MYRDVKIKLVGLDSNAFSIIGAVTGAMRKAGYDRAKQNEVSQEMMAGTYDDLLAYVMRNFEVVG